MKRTALKAAALQLNKYVVTEYSYKINLGAKPSTKEQPTTYQIKVDFDVKCSKTDPNKFLITMIIELNKKPSYFGQNRYQLSLNLMGEFQVAEGLDHTTKGKLVTNNGSAILYGIARGMVAQFTGGLGTERFILPVVNLLAIAQAKDKKSKTVSRR